MSAKRPDWAILSMGMRQRIRRALQEPSDHRGHRRVVRAAPVPGPNGPAPSTDCAYTVFWVTPEALEYLATIDYWRNRALQGEEAVMAFAEVAGSRGVPRRMADDIRRLTDQVRTHLVMVECCFGIREEDQP